MAAHPRDKMYGPALFWIADFGAAPEVDITSDGGSAVWMVLRTEADDWLVAGRKS